MGSQAVLTAAAGTGRGEAGAWQAPAVAEHALVPGAYTFRYRGAEASAGAVRRPVDDAMQLTARDPVGDALIGGGQSSS